MSQNVKDSVLAAVKVAFLFIMTIVFLLLAFAITVISYVNLPSDATDASKTIVLWAQRIANWPWYALILFPFVIIVAEIISAIRIIYYINHASKVLKYLQEYDVRTLALENRFSYSNEPLFMQFSSVKSDALAAINFYHLVSRLIPLKQSMLQLIDKMQIHNSKSGPELGWKKWDEYFDRVKMLADEMKPILLKTGLNFPYASDPFHIRWQDIGSSAAQYSRFGDHATNYAVMQKYADSLNASWQIIVQEATRLGLKDVW